MNKIEIYDPAMCCATGVCGPSIDPELTRMATAVFTLEKKGVNIQRFNLANEPNAFVQQTAVNKRLNEKGADCLPITMVNDEVVKTEEYPTNAELAKWAGVEEKELVASKPKSTFDIKLNVLE